MNTQIKNLWPACIIFLAISITIEFFVRIFNVPSYLFPAPSIIINEAVHFKNLIISNSFVTGVEAILGFLLGSITGVGIAILFVHSKLLERSIYPYTIALQTVPVIAIAPLLIVWFGGGIITKVLISGLICFFPVTVNTVKGFRSINPEAFDFFYTLNASKKQIFVLLRFPSALPYIFSALRISATTSIIGAIVAEFTAPDKGLGSMILIASYRLETIRMFIGIFATAVLGGLFFVTVVLLEKLVIPWHKQR